MDIAAISAQARPLGSDRRVLIAFIGLFILACIPVLSVDIPPLVDYPNHLARMYVLADGGRTPSLADYYKITWELLPNLAMDSIVPTLVRIMPLVWAGKCFLILLMAVTASGMMVLHRALWQRWSLWPCLGFGLLYNKILLWGFVNFLFGLGAALWVMALWVVSARMQMHWLARLVLLTAAATLVFFCHIEAQGLMFFALCGLEAPSLKAEIGAGRIGAALLRLIRLGVPFVPAAAMFLAAWQPHAAGSLALSAPGEKVAQLMTVFGDYNPSFDIVCSLLFLALFVAGGVTGRLTAVPALVWWLSIMIGLYVFMPNSMLSGSSADHRIPVITAMLLVVGTAPRLDVFRGPDTSRSRRIAWGLVAACLALFVIRLGLVEKIWLQANKVYAGDIATLSLIKPGSRMAVADPWDILHDTDIPQTHIPVLAVPLRQAFVPPIFAYPSQQPLRLNGRWKDLEAATKPDRIWAAFVENDTAERARLAPLLPKYDYLLFLFLAPFKVNPDPCLEFMGGSSSFQLYRIIPQHGLCPAR